MATKHIYNAGPNVMFVGGKMIGPGEGRDIDEIYLPPEYRDAPAEEVAQPPSIDELMAEQLKQSVAALVLLLPEWKLEALDRAAELEGAAPKPRKSLLTAIDAERLRRASAALGDGTGAGAGKGAGTGGGEGQGEGQGSGTGGGEGTGQGEGQGTGDGNGNGQADTSEGGDPA